MSDQAKDFIIVGFVRFVLGSLGIIANILQIAYCIIKKKYHSPFDRSVLSLSVADIISGLFFAVYGLVSSLLLLKNQNLIAIAKFTQYISIGINFSVIASFNHIIFIAAQRLLVVMFPLRIRVLFDGQRFNILLVLTWFLAAVYCVLSAAVFMSEYLKVNSYMIMISGIILVLLYAVLSYQTRKRDHILQDSVHVGTRVQNRTILLHAILVTAVFLVCFYPFAITYLYIVHGFVTAVICDLLITINPLLDAIIYFYIGYFRRIRTVAIHPA